MKKYKRICQELGISYPAYQRFRRAVNNGDIQVVRAFAARIKIMDALEDIRKLEK